MWILSGPFDVESGKPDDPSKTKLLKTGREYTLGRKDQPLIIINKAISKNHARFVVGSFTEEQAADPSFVPQLTYVNLTDRARPVERPVTGESRLLCPKNGSMDLEHGDIIHVSSSVNIRVCWERVCCYLVPGAGVSQVSASQCAELGIYIVPTPHPDVTHHLIPTYALTPPIATSLASVATLVKPEWLAATIAAGHAEAGKLSTLEKQFELPPPKKYRPNFSPSLPTRLKKYDVWEPNESRATLFKGYLFVFVGEKGAETQAALRELVKRAGGEYECVGVETGEDGLRKVLAKGRGREVSVVPVAVSAAAVAAVGSDGWKTLLAVARSFELKFIGPEKLLDAVIYTDVAHIDAAIDAEEVVQESVLPDVIPNTLEDEPSYVPTGLAPPPVPPPAPPLEQEPLPEPEVPQPPQRRKLVRRAVSRASSRAPSPPPPVSHLPPEQAPEPLAEEPPPPQPAPPRRTLVRRAGRAKAAAVADDDMAVDSERASEEPSASRSKPVSRADSIPPTPSRPRLKRRVGTQAPSLAIADSLIPISEDVLVPDATEPPLKKFKSLFDESDPDRVAKMSLEEYGSQHAGPSGAESMTQFEPSMTFGGATQVSKTRSGASAMTSQLGAVAEEEEDSTLPTRVSFEAQEHRGTKRKSQRGDDDVDMEEGERPRTKRRAGDEAELRVPTKPLSKTVTRVDMAHSQVYVKPKPPSKKAQAQGAPQGEPDKDAAFLKAVASTKRGKKTEDTFDREFNNLRISKPDLERQREDDDWKVLEDFGDDGDVRGNFMVVLEIPVFRETGSYHNLRSGEGRLEWQGRPDFKKFKRKTIGERRLPVELVVEEDNDIGIGSQYWKGSSETLPGSQSQPPPPSLAETKGSTTQRSTQRGAKERPSLVSDSEDEKVDVKPTRGKSQARGTSAKPSSSQAKGTKRSTRAKGAGSQRQPLFIDSDEDEDDNGPDGNAGQHHADGFDDDDDMGGTPPKPAGRSKEGQAKEKKVGGSKRKAPAVVVDDDSDDGATFKAFGARSRTKRR